MGLIYLSTIRPGVLGWIIYVMNLLFACGFCDMYVYWEHSRKRGPVGWFLGQAFMSFTFIILGFWICMTCSRGDLGLLDKLNSRIGLSQPLSSAIGLPFPLY